ncbi:hypothetical protein D3C79_897250 [compost metagenome]
MGNGVGNGPACAGQWAWACGFLAKALLQVQQVMSGLVVELIGYERYTLAVVMVVPVGQGCAQLCNFGSGLLGTPVRTVAGLGDGRVQQQQGCEAQER